MARQLFRKKIKFVGHTSILGISNAAIAWGGLAPFCKFQQDVGQSAGAAFLVF